MDAWQTDNNGVFIWGAVKVGALLFLVGLNVENILKRVYQPITITFTEGDHNIWQFSIIFAAINKKLSVFIYFYTKRFLFVTPPPPPPPDGRKIFF